jgi:hypothetical protein
MTLIFCVKNGTLNIHKSKQFQKICLEVIKKIAERISFLKV